MSVPLADNSEHAVTKGRVLPRNLQFFGELWEIERLLQLKSNIRMIG